MAVWMGLETQKPEEVIYKENTVGALMKRIDSYIIWKTGEFSLQLAVDTMAINKFLLFSADNAIFDMLFLTMERAVSFAF